jgi:F-type H+-transporting ATPase subunit epsilon
MLHVSVISPESLLFEGDAPSVVAPAYDGEVGILTGHAPMLTLLGKGTLRVGDGPSFSVAGGFLQVVDNQVRVVTEKAAKS